MEHAGDAGDQLDVYKQQAKQIIKKLNPRSPAKCSIESGLYMFQCVRTSCTCPLGPYSVAAMNRSYVIEEAVCYLTLCQKSFPKRLAFCYLEEIHEGFVAELRQDGDE